MITAVNPIIVFPFTKAGTLINFSNGIATDNPSWYATDYIEIPTGFTTISYTYTGNGRINFRGAFYDDNRDYVASDLTNVIWWFDNGQTKTLIIPVSARYIRLSTNSTTLFNTEMVMDLL